MLKKACIFNAFFALPFYIVEVHSVSFFSFSSLIVPTAYIVVNAKGMNIRTQLELFFVIEYVLFAFFGFEIFGINVVHEDGPSSVCF